MKVTRGYKTELDPTVKQHMLLCQCAGTARFSYNYGLARKQEVYKESGKTISAIDLQKELTARKHSDLPWLKGISSLAVCSDGRPPIKNSKALRANLKRLKRYQRHLSRCKEGSKNREKARHQATSSLVHTPLSPSERISLKTHLTSLLPLPKTKAEQKRGKKQVKKLIHQTTEINAPLRPQLLVLEDLNVEGMKRNRKLARAVSDVGMGEFRKQIEYKSLWNGEMLLFADRFFPSSKTCHGCNWKWEDMELSDRIFICQNPPCPLFQVPQDRDQNASENLVSLADKYLASLR
jgi:putative transposase